MNDTFQYKLTKSEKSEIAQNLIEILQKDVKIKKQTSTFISNWILTTSDEKRKAFFDVWEIVLKNYLPSERPILFRSCQRVSKKNRIASFTGRLECAKRFSGGKGTLIICDTNETLKFEEFSNTDSYTKSFYPLFRVLIKAKNSGGSEFSERLLSDYIGENEYIMKVDMENMLGLKWK
jgi:hypothetical protein